MSKYISMETAVVDANVFIHGRGSYPFQKALTVPEVVEELESDQGMNMIRTIDFTVRTPSESSIRKVKEKSEELNSPTSETDEKLLALALETSKPILTDDIALQNLAFHLDVEFEGFLEDEIENRFKWLKICKNCGNEVSGNKCSSCGSTLLRWQQVRCS